jgi:hypothetical protein
MKYLVSASLGSATLSQKFKIVAQEKCVSPSKESGTDRYSASQSERTDFSYPTAPPSLERRVLVLQALDLHSEQQKESGGKQKEGTCSFPFRNSS